jgi:hypothetical protein
MNEALDAAVVVITTAASDAGVAATTQVAASGGFDWKSWAIPALFWLLSAVLTALVVPNLWRLPAVTKKFFDWLYSKEGEIKNEFARGLLQRLSILIRDIVIQMENTAIEDIKEKARDGKITKEEMLELLKGVKNNAVDLAVNHIKWQGLFDVVLKVVFGNEESLKKWIADHIETQVATLPASGLQTVAPNVVMAAAEAGMSVVPAIVSGVAKMAEIKKAAEASATTTTPVPAAGTTTTTAEVPPTAVG